MIEQIKIIDNANKDVLIKLAKKYLKSDEVLYVALKGVFKEYLFCTNKRVCIIKRGYMTGHFFGESVFTLQYSAITNAEVDIKLFFGYFEVSAAGIENKDMNFWSTQRKNSPQVQPNALSINKSSYENFKNATQLILEKIDLQ